MKIYKVVFLYESLQHSWILGVCVQITEAMSVNQPDAALKENPSLLQFGSYLVFWPSFLSIDCLLSPAPPLVTVATLRSHAAHI